MPGKVNEGAQFISLYRRQGGLVMDDTVKEVEILLAEDNSTDAEVAIRSYFSFKTNVACIALQRDWLFAVFR